MICFRTLRFGLHFIENLCRGTKKGYETRNLGNGSLRSRRVSLVFAIGGLLAFNVRLMAEKPHSLPYASFSSPFLRNYPRKPLPEHGKGYKTRKLRNGRLRWRRVCLLLAIGRFLAFIDRLTAEEHILLPCGSFCVSFSSKLHPKTSAGARKRIQNQKSGE